MALATQINTLLDRWRAQLALSSWSAKTVAYPNKQFDPPSDDIWFRVAVFPGESRAASLSTATRRWRNQGVLIVEVYVPTGQTDEDAVAIADDVVGFFRGVDLTGIVMQAPSIERVGLDEGFYRMNISIPYHADDVV